MDDIPDLGHQPGQPRSERDAAFLKPFDAAMRLPIIVSAILPLIVAPESNDWVGVVVGISTWLVFGVDYVVHVRHLEHYGRTGFGRFDLFVVIVTAPWFLLPGAQAGGFVVLLRLVRSTLDMSTGPARSPCGWADAAAVVPVEEEADHRPDGLIVDLRQHRRAIQGCVTLAGHHRAPAHRNILVVGQHAHGFPLRARTSRAAMRPPLPSRAKSPLATRQCMHEH